jgi:hypothetical protein
MPDHPECCTLISYCGLQNLEYPDKTAMGYPFDRLFQPSSPATGAVIQKLGFQDDSDRMSESLGSEVSISPAR